MKDCPYTTVLKKSKVVPLHKKGIVLGIENFRLSTIINNFLKVMEIALLQRIFNHVKYMITDRQMVSSETNQQLQTCCVLLSLFPMHLICILKTTWFTPTFLKPSINGITKFCYVNLNFSVWMNICVLIIHIHITYLGRYLSNRL